MAEEKHPAATRIDDALARIDRALAARSQAHDRLIERHAVLRARVSDAIDAIDALLSESPR